MEISWNFCQSRKVGTLASVFQGVLEEEEILGASGVPGGDGERGDGRLPPALRP